MKSRQDVFSFLKELAALLGKVKLLVSSPKQYVSGAKLQRVWRGVGTGGGTVDHLLKSRWACDFRVPGLFVSRGPRGWQPPERRTCGWLGEWGALALFEHWSGPGER